MCADSRRGEEEKRICGKFSEEDQGNISKFEWWCRRKLEENHD
jgi:hypothetical protein